MRAHTHLVGGGFGDVNRAQRNAERLRGDLRHLGVQTLTHLRRETDSAQREQREITDRAERDRERNRGIESDSETKKRHK